MSWLERANKLIEDASKKKAPVIKPAVYVESRELKRLRCLLEDINAQGLLMNYQRELWPQQSQLRFRSEGDYEAAWELSCDYDAVLYGERVQESFSVRDYDNQVGAYPVYTTVTEQVWKPTEPREARVSTSTKIEVSMGSGDGPFFYFEDVIPVVGDTGYFKSESPDRKYNSISFTKDEWNKLLFWRGSGGVRKRIEQNIAEAVAKRIQRHALPRDLETSSRDMLRRFRG